MDISKWLVVAAIIAIIVCVIVRINSDYKGYDVVNAEPGVKCVRVHGIYNQSISCWKE